MAEDGGILSEEMKTAAMEVLTLAHDALMHWAARDPNPDADGTHPSYALADVDGEALASALVLAATSFGAGAHHEEQLTAAGALWGASFFGETAVQPMAEVLDFLLTETVARLTGGGGPGV